MSDQDNIIPFRDPQMRATKKRQDAVDPFIEALKDKSRKREWYPVFALNLGEMARRLDQEKPLEAARRMFREAFGETAADANWRKRKRYIRFEGEEASFDRPGDYVSNKEPYRLLADAFAKLHFAGDEDGPRNAHRMLFRGTSLYPRPTVDASQADGLAQALDCLRHLQSKCATDQEIASALHCLNRFPIAPFGANEDVRCGETGRMRVAKRGKVLSIVPRPTSTISICADLDAIDCWYVGRVLLGYLYFPQIISSVSLGMTAEECIPEIDDDMPEEDLFNNFNELVASRLNELEVEDFFIGDERHGSPIPHRLERTIHIRKPVYVLISHDGTEPRLKLDIVGERYGHDDGFFYGCVLDNPEIFKLGATPSEDELIFHEVPTFNSFNGIRTQFVRSDIEEIFEWDLRVVVSDNNAHVVGGGIWRDYPTMSYTTVVDDVEMRDALVEGANADRAFFRPMIWDDLSRLSAAPHGSIAASILRNLAFAPQEQRIDTLLIKDARERLSGVVEFVQAELEKINLSLEQRGIEI